MYIAEVTQRHQVAVWRRDRGLSLYISDLQVGLGQSESVSFFAEPAAVPFHLSAAGSGTIRSHTQMNVQTGLYIRQL